MLFREWFVKDFLRLQRPIPVAVVLTIKRTQGINPLFYAHVARAVGSMSETHLSTFLLTTQPLN